MENNLPENVKKYLKKFSFRNVNIFPKTDNKYDLITVIPAIDEFENIKILIDSFEKNKTSFTNKILILFVINNSDSANEKVKKENLKTIRYLKELINQQKTKFRYSFIDLSSTGNTLPEKIAGVGLARKIGMDAALLFFDYTSFEKKILLCCDADCTVATNYFDEVYKNFNNKKLTAAYVKYFHPINLEDKNSDAIINYEIFLRYYVLGLKYSHSAFAIHTIGSTMACDFEHYIKIQGMNKRKAAEDFYFMEKLAKITEVKEIKTTEIYPSNRGSWRVPFGTGQRVNRFISKERDEYLLYSPESFEILKKWNNYFFNLTEESEKKIESDIKKISASLFLFLEKNNFFSDWKNIISNSKQNIQLRKQKNFWFDGFKTLKLIHYLRDTSFPQVPMFEALDVLFFKCGIKTIERKEKIPALEIQFEYLKTLRENT